MNKILRSVLLIGAIAVLTSTAVLTQTTAPGITYTFPNIEMPGLQLVVSNVSTVDTSVKVTIFNPNGSTAVSFRIPLGAGKQTIVDDSALALSSFSGSAIVESATPISVTATSTRSGSLDSFVPSASSAELVLPFASAGANGDTVVTIFNPGTQNADVLVMLGKANGVLVNGPRIALAARENRSVSLDSLAIPAAELDGVTHIIVRSLGNVFIPGRAVSAVAKVTSFNNGSGLVRADAAFVQGVASDLLSSTAFVPLFVKGFGYFSGIQIVNPTDAPEAVTLVARGPTGANLSGLRNPLTVTVPAHGAYSGDVQQTFNLTADAIGAISVTGSGRFAAVGILGADGAPSLTAISPAADAASNFIFQYRSVSRSYFSGLTFINSNGAAADVSLTFVTSDGFTVSRAQLSIPAINQVTKTLADMLPEATGSGFLYVSSNRPLQAAGIEGPNDASILSSLPVSAVAAGFTPRPQEKFLAVGVARVAGDPIPGATVRLIGPVLATQPTDSVGSFVFRDIPPGNYTVTIQMAGITFTPSQTSFTITTENKRDLNFDGVISATTLTSIVPPSVLAGSSGVLITVNGGPFIPSSEILFEGAAIPTTFVNDHTLTAALGAEAIRLARPVPVQVRNRVGLSSAPTQALTFVVGSPAPVITALSGVPQQIIAGYPGFTVTVTGTGFTEGGTVEFAGVPRGYVWDSPTQVRAFLGPADLAVGRIAPLTASNPFPTVGPSNSLPITVFNPVAGMTAISPNKTEIKIEPNSTGLQIVVDGFLFKPGAKVQVAGVPALTTTYVSATRLIADLPPQALEVGGSFPVTVANPAPNLGSSEAQPLIVENLVPKLTSLDTGPMTFTPGISEEATLPVNFIIVAHGANFGKEYSAVMVAPPGAWPSCNQPDPIALPAQVVSSTEMVLTASIRCRGTFRIAVGSPQNEPGGGVSSSISFDVVAPTAGPVPVLTSLAPASIPAGSAFTLQIIGSGFVAGAKVNFGTAILTPNAADITATSILVSVPAFYVQEKGLIPITVTNPGTGGTSARLLLIVN